MPRRKIDPAVKAAATADALAGGSSRSVARRYQVDHSAVARWRRYPYPQDKAEQINARVFALMLEGLDTLAEHYRAARAPDWVSAQTAADLAQFDGMAHDRLLGLVEAVRAAAERRDAAALPEPGDAVDAAPEPDTP